MLKQVVPPISFYAELRYAFKHAQKDAPFFRLAFLPTQATHTTYLLRAIGPLFLMAFVGSYLLENSWLFALALSLEVLAIFLLENEIQRGVEAELPGNSAVQNLSKQPRRLRRPIIRYAYFKEQMNTARLRPSIAELTATLKIVEINRSNRPPGVTGLMRHPMVVAVFVGILVYAFNAKIVGSPGAAADWRYFLLVLFALAALFWVASIAYALRYMEPLEEWQFERCLRWYQLERESEAQPMKRGRKQSGADNI